MRKKSIAILALASVALFSCGGPKKTVLLEGGNAYDLLQQYISKTHAKPGDLQVEIWDGKNLKAYSLSWQSTITGADYMSLWKERLGKVNALYKPGLDKEAKANRWDVYISPTLTLQKTSSQKTQNKKPGTCNVQASSDINLGLQLVASGDLKNASKQFKQAIKDDNSCALGYIDLASAYINRKDYDKAIDVAKEGLKNAGENKDLEYVLACAYSRDKKLDYSLDALKKALKDGFNDPDKLAHDPDLQNLRLGKKKDFCELLNKYKITIKYCLV
jgi:tetratricopeptide (TPR) repeat protein